MTELSPTKKHLKDPYVLQLIEALSVRQDEIEELEERDKSREGAEHYGPYGANCMNQGQFDAGECWLCAGKRKQKERNEVREELQKVNEDLTAANDRCNVLHGKMTQAINAFDSKCHDAAAWEASANSYKEKSGEMQLVAGRYQYQFEQAMKCINSIDDLFEYRYKACDHDMLQKAVRGYLACFTNAVKPKEPKGK